MRRWIALTPRAVRHFYNPRTKKWVRRAPRGVNQLQLNRKQRRAVTKHKRTPKGRAMSHAFAGILSSYDRRILVEPTLKAIVREELSRQQAEDLRYGIAH